MDAICFSAECVLKAAFSLFESPAARTPESNEQRLTWVTVGKAVIKQVSCLISSRVNVVV